MIKAAIFDLDGTLYDYKTAHGEAWRALTAFVGEKLGIAPGRFETLHAEADRVLRLRTGGGSAIHDRMLRYQLVLEQVGGPLALAPTMTELYWSTLLNCMKSMPGAARALDRLRHMGLVIGIGTNMTADWQYAKLIRLGLMEMIDFIVTSEEAGAEKPEKRLFDLCAEKAGCVPGDCAFVGDSLKGDALGALGAGMHAVWLCTGPDTGAPPPDGVLRIRSLEELPERLMTL